MRAYLSILRDSFREAFVSKALWAMLALIGLLLIVCACFGYKERTNTKFVRGDVIDDRLRHGITENVRVDAAVEAVQSGDVAALGGLLMESHQSLRHEYAVSCAELDSMVALAASEPGCFGARMMGGGFGGCALALVSEGAAEAVWTGAIQGYRRRYPHSARAFRVRLVGGAGGHRTTSL